MKGKLVKKKLPIFSTKLHICCLLLCLHIPVGSCGDDLLASSQSDLLVVLGVGAAGGILGLSTLSFMDEPQDHLKNIWVGASLGVIIGVAVIAYNQASRSHELFYEQGALTPLFDTAQRISYHQQNFARHLAVGPCPWAWWSYQF